MNEVVIARKRHVISCALKPDLYARFEKLCVHCELNHNQALLSIIEEAVRTLEEHESH